MDNEVYWALHNKDYENGSYLERPVRKVALPPKIAGLSSMSQGGLREEAKFVSCSHWHETGDYFSQCGTKKTELYGRGQFRGCEAFNVKQD